MTWLVILSFVGLSFSQDKPVAPKTHPYFVKAKPKKAARLNYFGGKLSTPPMPFPRKYKKRKRKPNSEQEAATPEAN